MNIKPLGDRVVVTRVEEESKTAGGLIIPDNAKEKPQQGKVVRVGAGRVNKDGVRTAPDIKEGDTVKRTGAIEDPLIRLKLTESWTGLQAMRSYAMATMDVEQPGQDNVSKLLWANWHRELGEIAMEIQGMAGLTLPGGEFDEWQRLFLFSRSDTIYGGSNEIQRNILAKAELGL